jgi:anti-sigma-K factor RskA
MGAKWINSIEKKFKRYAGVKIMMTEYKYPQEWEELLAGYVLGDLEPEEVTAMQEIIVNHPEIITEIDRLQETLAILPLGLSPSYPSEGLRDRIASVAIPQSVQSPMIASTETGLKKSANRQNIWKLVSIGLGSISAIAAIALIALGFDNYQMRQQIATNQVELQKYKQAIALLQGGDNRMIPLKGMGATPAATGSVMIAPSEKMAMISIQNLTQIPQETSYRLWAIVDGKKVDCAQFRPDAQGNVFLKVPLGNALKQSTTVIITVEQNTDPNKNSSEPTGEMVMKGEV